MTEENRYCGVAVINQGSSWAYADSPVKAALLAAEKARKDWAPLYDLSDSTLLINILDTEGHEGWLCDGHRFLDTETGEEIPVHDVIHVAPGGVVVE